MTMREEIIRLAGEVDEMTIAEIARTGASLADIEQAARWATGEAVTRSERHELSGRAEAVYDILMRDPAFRPVADMDDR